MNRTFLPPTAACLVALCLALSACGNKGDLFLPPPEPTVVDEVDATPAATLEDDADDAIPADDGDAGEDAPVPPPEDGDGAA